MFVAFVDELIGFNTGTTVTFIRYNGNEKAIQLLSDLIDRIGDDAFDDAKDAGGSEIDRYTLDINKLIPEEHVDILIKYSFGETYYNKYTGAVKTDTIESVLKKVNKLDGIDDDDDDEDDDDKEGELTFEINVIEDGYTNYDGCDATDKNVVKRFVNMCKKHVDPHDVKKHETRLYRSSKTITLADRSGNDKPCTVTLVGNITNELYEKIKDELKILYEDKDEDEDGDEDKDDVYREYHDCMIDIHELFTNN